MALMRSLRRLTRYAPKAKRLAEDNAGKIAENVSKATDFVDDKTKGRYTGTLRKVDEKANQFAEQQGQSPATGGNGDATAPGTDDTRTDRPGTGASGTDDTGSGGRGDDPGGGRRAT